MSYFQGPVFAYSDCNKHTVKINKKIKIGGNLLQDGILNFAFRLSQSSGIKSKSKFIVYERSLALKDIILI